MIRYNQDFLIKVLEKHGYNPNSLDGGWKQFAMSLIIAERLEELFKK